MFTTILRSLPIFFVTLALAGTTLADDAGNRLLPKGARIDADLRREAMPELADTQLGKFLGRYYKRGLGGPEVWSQIESLRVSGTLRLPAGEFDLSAFQKKPDRIKMTIEGNQRDLVLGYDGEVAWQSSPRQAGKFAPMGEREARRFIHSARFGNYLLYPFEEGKTITYLDTVPVEGTICHQIRVVLETEYQVDYFIDIRDYFEIKVVNTDLRTGFVNSVIYENYTRKEGLPIAQKVRSTENGEWVSTLEVGDVAVNTGLMPWMFGMPE